MLNPNSMLKFATDRVGTSSLKWDGAETKFGGQVLPMWVADMDLKAPDNVIEALQRRVNHGVYGYPWLGEEFRAAAMEWMQKRHNWNIREDWIVPVTGVVPALYAAVRALTSPGDSVVAMTPVYQPIMKSITDNQRHLIEVPLIADKNQFSIDWELLQVSLERARLMVLCSPHNPVGRVWSRDELVRLVRMCEHVDCQIVSDEIHADLTYLKSGHIPLLKEYERGVVLTSPGKSFNLAGVSGAIGIVADSRTRKKIQDSFALAQIHHPHLFALISMTVAWQLGMPWQIHLRDYLLQSSETIAHFLRRYLPEVDYQLPAFGYLAWLNTKAYGNHIDIKNRLLREGLGLSEGLEFGKEGSGYFRMNFGTSPELIKEGLHRFRKALLY